MASTPNYIFKFYFWFVVPS